MPVIRGLAFLLAGLLAAAPAWADAAADVRLLVRNADLAAALARAQAAAAAKPNDAAVRFLEGVILLDLKRDDDALAAFRRMTQDFPDLPEPYNNVALLEARAGRLEAARSALESALRNDPAHATARANLGEIHLRLALQAWEAASPALPGDTLLRRKIEVARELAGLRR